MMLNLLLAEWVRAWPDPDGWRFEIHREPMADGVVIVSSRVKGEKIWAGKDVLPRLELDHQHDLGEYIRYRSRSRHDDLMEAVAALAKEISEEDECQ